MNILFLFYILLMMNYIKILKFLKESLNNYQHKIKILE